MGNCYVTSNPGEDFVYTIINHLKVNRLFYNELYFWVESKKTLLSYEEAKEHIEATIDNEKLREETISLLDKENKEYLLLFDYENFSKDNLYRNTLRNNYSNTEGSVLRMLFSKHYEFNCFHFLLCMLSLTDDTKHDKINFFFEICTKIKRNFTFQDLNGYLYSYLLHNLNSITSVVHETCSQESSKANSLKLDLEYLLKNVYTLKNIRTFRDNILMNYTHKIFDRSMDNKYVMTKEDFHEIFFDKDYLFDIRELRDHFLTIYRDFL